MGGGYRFKHKKINDILLFDTKAKKVTTEVENGDLQFYSFSNECALTAPN